MRNARNFQKLQWVFIFLLAGVLPACVYFDALTGSSSTGNTGQTVPVETSVSKESSVPLPVGPVYYDFRDVPTPRELKLDEGRSYVFEGAQTKGGLLVLKGRVEINSIVRFFELAMQREQWKQKGAIRNYHSVLMYEKPDKACIINIFEGNFSTTVEIYVIPYEDQKKPVS